MTTQLLSYLFEASVCQAAFYLFYHLFLRRETYFIMNRIFILVSVLLSLVIPVIDIPLQKEVLPVAYTFTLQEFSTQATPSPNTLSWQEWLLYAYSIPCLLLLLKLLFHIGKLFYISRSSRSTYTNSYRLIFTEGKYPTFSFFRLVFWDNSQPLAAEDKAQILQHELTHVQQWHSADILLMEIVQAFFWFNPVVYLFKRHLQAVHEYLADAAVAKRFNTTAYIQLIINHTFNKLNFSFTSSFNQSQIKNRIHMLTHLKNTKPAVWKVLLSLPVIALLVFMYSCDSNESGKMEPVAEFPADASPDDILAAYKGKYPDIAFAAIHVNKPVDANGKGDIRITVKNVDNADDKRTIENQLSEAAMKRLVIAPPLAPDASAPNDAPAVSKEMNEIFQVVEQQPEPVGGMETLFKYISKNLVYATEAREKGIEGKVFVQFIVNKDGSVSDVQVLKGLGYGLDAEAVRVIQNMPAWQPGKQRGQPVNVRMSIPISFKLN